MIWCSKSWIPASLITKSLMKTGKLLPWYPLTEAACKCSVVNIRWELEICHVFLQNIWYSNLICFKVWCEVCSYLQNPVAYACVCVCVCMCECSRKIKFNAVWKMMLYVVCLQLVQFWILDFAHTVFSAFVDAIYGSNVKIHFVIENTEQNLQWEMQYYPNDPCNEC